jgi:hypothetical protein
MLHAVQIDILPQDIMSAAGFNQNIKFSGARTNIISYPDQTLASFWYYEFNTNIRNMFHFKNLTLFLEKLTVQTSFFFSLTICRVVIRP